MAQLHWTGMAFSQNSPLPLVTMSHCCQSNGSATL